jgi:hypothetical protein
LQIRHRGVAPASLFTPGHGFPIDRLEDRILRRARPLAGISPEVIRLIEGNSQRVEPGLIEPDAEATGESANQRWECRWIRTRRLDAGHEALFDRPD